ncbi:MAG: GTP-binding protein [Cardiobacteriaceae bacterium]|nr:GTP-binding protein [Cardiobacteriaceae bacterium]
MIWKKEPKTSSKPSSTADSDKSREHVEKARESVEALLGDKRLNDQARARLGEDYRQLQRLLDKLERGHVHVAAFGRVSVGKSALLNALVGEDVFATSVLHGETKHSAQTLWQRYDSGGVYLLDTPGIDEVNGQERAQIAENVARQADVILFVVDGDMTDIEYNALFELYRPTQPMLLVLNKVDRLGGEELATLLAHLRRRVADLLPPEHVVAASAAPEAILEIREDAQGRESEHWITPPADVEEVRERLWQLLEKSGKSYAALNAGVFASQLSEKVGEEIVAARRDIAEKIIRHYALLKAVGVAINPLPVVDLLALAADGSMVVHLSKVYGIAMTRHQAGELIRTIALQTGILMGTVYGVQALSSVLKGLTAGFSTILTAGAQGGVAFYGSYVIGKAAERYFAQGASWGERGAKRVIEEILADLDRDRLVQEAKSTISEYFSKK